MDDSWALIARGDRWRMKFEYTAVTMAKSVVHQSWPRGLVDDDLAETFPAAISLFEVQEIVNTDSRGTGFDTGGAETVFAGLVRLGVLRPVTDDQFRAIAIVHARARSGVRVKDQSNWYKVVPDALERLYPGQPR